MDQLRGHWRRPRPDRACTWAPDGPRDVRAADRGRRRKARRFITWDARCHGDTENTADPFTYWDLADDLKGLLDHLGIERAVIGGMSQGGFVALRFALKYPERVSALVLIGTQAGDRGSREGRDLRGHARRLGGRGPERPAGAHHRRDHPWQRVARAATGGSRSGARSRARCCARHSRRWSSRDDIHHRLGEITAPALVIHGTADAAIELEKAQRLCSELANCRGMVADRRRRPRVQPHASQAGQSGFAAVPGRAGAAVPTTSGYRKTDRREGVGDSAAGDAGRDLRPRRSAHWPRGAPARSLRRDRHPHRSPGGVRGGYTIFMSPTACHWPTTAADLVF